MCSSHDRQLIHAWSVSLTIALQRDFIHYFYFADKETGLSWGIMDSKVQFWVPPHPILGVPHQAFPCLSSPARVLLTPMCPALWWVGGLAGLAS